MKTSNIEKPEKDPSNLRRLEGLGDHKLKEALSSRLFPKTGPRPSDLREGPEKRRKGPTEQRAVKKA